MDRNSPVKQRWLLIGMTSAMLLSLLALATCVASWERVGRESEARIEKQRAIFDGPAQTDAP